jgi:copper chaperone CopZ
MNAQQAEHYFELAMEKWQQAIDTPNNAQANGLYQTASGYLTNIVQSNLANEEILGTITMFYYDYAVFFAQRLKNGRDSSKQLNVADAYAKRALALNPHQLDVRLYQVVVAADMLVGTPKPNTLNTLMSGGGWFKKGFDIAADLTAYNKAKGEFNEAVLKLATAFDVAIEKGLSIEACNETVERMLRIVDGVFEHEVNVAPLLETICRVDYNKLTYYSPEEELDSLISTFHQTQQDIKARLMR